MIEVITGDTVLLELVLADGDTTRFPQAEIYDDAGAAIGASPVDLSGVADGLYQGTFTAPAVGGYSIIYITYSDAGHTTLVGNIERVSEHMRVTNAVQDDVWTEALPGAFGAGSAGNIVGNNVDATISSRSTLVQADILSDATPFPGADIDAAISSRSSHTAANVDALITVSHGAGSYQTATGFAVAGDNMGLTAAATAAVDVELTATHGAGSWSGTSISQQDVRDAMKLTPTAGPLGAGSVDSHLDIIQADTAAIEPLVTTNLNATVSSRSTLAQADILSDATPFAGANVDTTVSSRGTADPGDAMTLTAGERTAIDAQLSGTHGAGNWESASATDWTGTEKQQIRQALGVTGLVAATAAGELQDILADTAVIEPLVSTNLNATVSSRSTLVQADILSDATPFPGADIDAAISTRSSHTAADVDALVTASHGAGSYQTATGFAVPADNMGLTAAGVDGIWDEPIAGHLGVGSTGEALDDASAGSSPAAVSAAVWAEALPGAFAAGSSGKIVGDNIDATIASRAAPADNMGLTAAATAAVDAELTGTHGAGSWATGGAGLTQQNVRDAMKLAPTAGAPSAGSVDTHLDDIESDTGAMQPVVAANLNATVSSRATPGDAMSIDAAGVDAIFDESLAGHLGAGTAGQALAAAFGNAGGNVRDDALTYDANDRPLTLRRRIFPDAATANASTPGGVGEGELITVTMSAVQIDAAKWETLLRTI